MTASRKRSRQILDDDDLDELIEILARGVVRTVVFGESREKGLAGSPEAMALLRSTGGGAVSAPRKEARS